jgi:hypothetical protein
MSRDVSTELVLSEVEGLDMTSSANGGFLVQTKSAMSGVFII